MKTAKQILQKHITTTIIEIVQDDAINAMEEYCQQENKFLIKQNERMQTAIRKAISVEDLWIYSGTVLPENENEAQALRAMSIELRASLMKGK